MVFAKDDLVVIVTCFTEKGWTGTLNPLDYSIWDVLQELVDKGRLKPFANVKDLQNVITAILQWKRCLAEVSKQNGRPLLHIFC